jgi:carotenoid 1,2-hydratase
MRGPRFDLDVAPGGYAWWYLDAASDDGRHGLTVIAFVGSVFSPFYARARRRGPAAAIDHCAINVALYGDVDRWAMTERDADAVTRTAERFVVGPSQWRWQDDVLVIDVDEVTVPWPTRLRGSIRVHPQAATDYRVALDANGRHHWQPVAPHAHVELEFTAPALHWSGAGYLDSNAGSEPLEAAFASWHWSRARQADDTTQVFYDVGRRDGTSLALGLSFDRHGNVQPCPALPVTELPPTLWRIRRRLRGSTDSLAHIRTVEDTPFYARSMVMGDGAQSGQVVHESLSLDRFDSRWVQTLLPFRMWRRRTRRDG